ncbi:MAG: molybdenum cofactor biosynthesis protein MoaE [Labilithrix sp.]|nr:molybdenum cofactor biosynthesis protein MoaE [Labilithrix sp.]
MTSAPERAGARGTTPDDDAPRTDVREAPLSVDEALARVRRPGAGGLAVFVGVVRDESAGRAVTRLEYSAYASMARREMERVAVEIEAELPGVRVAAMHRTGSLEVGEAAVVCAASAPHRGEAFEACRALIDRIKSRVPIWKREIGPDGAAWVGWEDARCGPGHEHDAAGHEHDAARREHDAARREPREP